MSRYVGFRCLQLCNCSTILNALGSRRLASNHRLYNDSSLISPVRYPSDTEQDILLKSIRSSKETSDVLHYVGKHYNVMNRPHILQALRIIFSMQKSDKTVLSNGEVIRSPEFHTLCNVLKSRVRSLHVNEAIDVLKTLSYLGVPASSKLVSILLNILATRVNELSLQQIVFLEFLVKDFKPTPIVEALKLALPIVFQANLNVKLDRDNVKQACNLLHFVARKKLPVETMDSLIDVIMRLRHQLDLDSAVSVIKSICDFEPNDESHRPLLNHAFDTVLDNIDECSFGDLDILLSKCVAKHSRENYFFYHEDFVNGVSDFVVKNDCGFEEAIWTLRKLNKLSYIDIKLLDYVSTKAEIELFSSSYSKATVLFTLVKGLSIADYKPRNWDVLEPTIVKMTENMFLEESEMPWISFIRDLCSLGTWPMSIIEKIFQVEFLEQYLKAISSHGNILDQLQLLSLYQEVTALCPEPYRPSSPLQLLDSIVDINGKNLTTYPLLRSLERGLGGAPFVASGVYSELGHFLHHVVAFREGCPVPLKTDQASGSRTYLHDLGISEEHRPVVLMHLPPSFYCSNVDKLRGLTNFHLNSIGALGLSVVPISSSRWEALLEHEKIPYLIREIKEKCDFTSLETVAR